MGSALWLSKNQKYACKFARKKGENFTLLYNTVQVVEYFNLFDNSYSSSLKRIIIGWRNDAIKARVVESFIVEKS